MARTFCWKHSLAPSDIDYGIYPIPRPPTPWRPMDRQARNPGAKVDCVIGIMKAYSTCVGEDLYRELFGEEASALREAGRNTEPPQADLAG